MDTVEFQIEWLKANASRITYLRPRKRFGKMIFIAYNKHFPIPYIEGQPFVMVDSPTDTRLRDTAISLGISIEEPRF